MNTTQSQRTKKPSEENQTGWKIFAKVPHVEDFEPPERAKAEAIPPRNTADFAEFGVPLRNPWESR